MKRERKGLAGKGQCFSEEGLTGATACSLLALRALTTHPPRPRRWGPNCPRGSHRPPLGGTRSPLPRGHEHPCRVTRSPQQTDRRDSQADCFMILVRHGTERRFASDRSRQRARDDHCDTRGVARRASACQCRRERGEAPGAADREAQIYDRQAAPRQVRPIFGAGRHPGATRAGARGDGRRCRSGGNGGADGSCSGQD